VDKVEQLAIDRAKQLFGAEHANVQPHSGSQANFAVYTSVLQPGDKILAMNLSHGGHLTHGNPANFSGKLYKVVAYGVREDNQLIDYDQLSQVALAERPRMITVGASAYSRVIDFARMGEIARSCGAFLFADVAHIAGLIVTGHHPSPIPHADFVTTTTHKTLRGPRGGLILCRAAHAKAIDSAVFPGAQGGPLMHVIAAKAVCFHECLKPEFRAYSAQIISNARALAAAMASRGYRIVSGGTDNHLFLADLRTTLPELTAKKAQETLDLANITTNKNTVPFETRSPFQASGLRLGTPAVTTRGMLEPQMAEIAEMIDTVLRSIGTPGEAAAVAAVKARAAGLTAAYPLPYRT
jgi:glycine hydroxymethyltransferase